TDELNKTIAKYIPSYKPNEKSAVTLEKTSTKEIGKDLKAHLPTNQNPIKLPKTGENTDLIFVFIGVLMLAGLTTSKIK
ncbi:LPXTG cell wall anchor domain-containing protein, partial [Listeria innocua]